MTIITPEPDCLVDLNVAGYRETLKPCDIISEFPRTPDESSKISIYRRQIQDVYRGLDPRMILVVGPCSIHNYDGAIRYGQKLKKFIDEENVSENLIVVMRTYIEKPRTGPDWPGYIFDPGLTFYISQEECEEADITRCDLNQGRRLSRKLLKELTGIGLPLAMEFLDLNNPQYIDDYISWGAIGARTNQTPVLRWLASALSMPIGFKNDVTGDKKSAIDGVITSRFSGHVFEGIRRTGDSHLVIGKGNHYTHPILRGGNGSNGNGPNYGPEHITETLGLIKKAKEKGNGRLGTLEYRLGVDCSHGNCTVLVNGKLTKVANEQLNAGESLRQQVANGERGIFLVMYESNYTGGSQEFPKDVQSLSSVDPNITLTDPGLPWDIMAEEILRWNHTMRTLRK